MDFGQPLSAKELVKGIESSGITIRGDPDRPISGLNIIQKARPNDLAFADSVDYVQAAVNRRVGALITTPTLAETISDGDLVVLVAPEPFIAFRAACTVYGNSKLFGQTARASQSEKFESLGIQVSATSQIDENARLGEGSSIGAETIISSGVYIGPAVQIGRNCHIHPNVVLEAGVRIGDRVTLGAGTVIGSLPNAYKWIGDSFYSYFPVGTVLIDDDVEIGALCTVDRCLTDVTVVGQRCRIGNGVMIGHGARLDTGVLVIAHSAIAGNTVIGEHAEIRAQSGINHDLTVGRNAVVEGRSGVTKNVAEDQTVIGNYAEPKTMFLRKEAAVKFLPALRRDLNDFIRRTRNASDDWKLFMDVVASELDVNASEVTDMVRFNDLGADSLDLVELGMQLEEEFGLPDKSLEQRFARELGTVTASEVFTYIQETSGAKREG